MQARQLVRLSLLASAISLTACGGSDSEQPTPPTINQAPVITLNPSSGDALEKSTVGLSATAKDADGSIANYSWKITSNHNFVLSGADTASVSFTAPNVDLDGDTVTLEVMVTDNLGATATAVTALQIKPITIPLTLAGLATDSPLSNAKMTVNIGGRDIGVDALAGADGRFNIDLVLDDSEATAFISVVARGVGQQSDAGLISLLGTAEELSVLAGEDNILTADEHFMVNVTNITTAKYALARIANKGESISSSDQLESLFAQLHYDEVMLLATAIKVAIDKASNNPDLALHRSIPDTLALVEDIAQTKAYVQLVAGTSEFSEAQQEIYQDKNLIDTSSAYQVPSTYFLLPPSTFSSGAVFNFSDDGKGNNGDIDFEWQETDGVISANVNNMAPLVSYLFIPGYNNQVKVEDFIDKYQLKRLSTGEKSDLLLITQFNRRHFPDGEFADEITTETYTRNAVKEAGVNPITHTGAGIVYITIKTKQLDDTTTDTSFSSEKLILNANGQGTEFFSRESFGWKVEQGTLKLSYANGAQARIKRVQAGGTLDRFAFEFSEDGLHFRGYSVGDGKILTDSPKWSATDIPGVYSSDSAVFPNPLQAFWFELHTNGDADTISTYDANEDGILTADEVGIMYGRWELNNDGSVTVTRVRKIRGGYSPDCREATTEGCVLYHQRNWALVAKQDRQYGVLHKHHFNYSNIGANRKDLITYDNRILQKLDRRPVDIDSLPVKVANMGLTSAVSLSNTPSSGKFTTIEPLDK